MALQREFSSAADFALVYLEEAHPTDGWVYGAVRHAIAQHASLEERCDAARRLVAELDAAEGEGEREGASAQSMEIYVDLLDNGCSTAYGALPERLAILHRGRVAFLGGPGPMMYSIDECREALHRLVGPQE